MALGIIVTDMQGNRLTFSRAVGRNILKIISGLTLSVGYIMAGFTVRRQALHDKIASCLVLNKNADVNNLYPLLSSSPITALLFCAACILPVILVIGISAAIALPQYFISLDRSRMAESLSALSAISVAQQRYFLRQGTYSVVKNQFACPFVSNFL
jgi:hypothetical protein